MKFDTTVLETASSGGSITNWWPLKSGSVHPTGWMGPSSSCVVHALAADFTLLDDLSNDRATADDNPRIAGFIRSNWEDRFGQGGQVSFRKFEIEG